MLGKLRYLGMTVFNSDTHLLSCFKNYFGYKSNFKNRI